MYSSNSFFLQGNGKFVFMHFWKEKELKNNIQVVIDFYHSWKASLITMSFQNQDL